jgi:hypothetical protein
MRYRCPLCLKALDRDDELWKFCPQHRDANPDPLNPYQPDENQGGFFCSERGCDAHRRFQPDGLLYRHATCRLETGPGTFQPLWNPFWAPAASHISDWVTVRRGGLDERQQVHHWELHALRQTQGVGAQEMWYPAGLLAAEGQHPHVLVSFSGAKKVGKTYLAMRLLDFTAYCGAKRPVEDFLYLYSYPSHGVEAMRAGAVTTAGQSPALAVAAPTSDEFLQTLYLREMLRHSEPRHFEDALNSTSSRPRNLKAALFPAVARDQASDRGGASIRRLPLLQRLPFSRSATEFIEAIGQRLAVRGDAPYWPYRGLLVYDLAGEAVEEGHVDVRRHDEAMDVIAVLVSAEDLTSPTPNMQALAIAIDRINHARDVKGRRRDVRCCLVVTKCDLWPGGPPPGRREALVRQLKSLDSSAAAAQLFREVAAVGRSRSTLDRVFFTWRERRGPSLEPVHGLDEFATWCLR